MTAPVVMSPGVRTRLSSWLLATLAWLIGIAWQLSESALWPQRVYAFGAMASLGLIAVWWCLANLSWQGCPPRFAAVLSRLPGQAALARMVRPQHRAHLPTALRWALGLGAVALLAWSSTGWRAAQRLAERVPDAWLGKDIMVDVQVEGLPQPVPGGAQFDARVLAWPGGAGEPELAPGDGAVLGRGQSPTQSIGRLPTLLSLRMVLADGALPWAGQRWRLAVRLHPPDGPSNPAGFDATLRAFERGVRAMGTVRDRGAPPFLMSAEPEHAWQGMIDRARQRIRAAIVAHVADKRVAGVLAGLSVGDQSAIDRDDWDVFRRTGVAHLVSISGAHIAMLGWLGALVVRRAWPLWQRLAHWLPAPDAARWAAVSISTAYAMLAGWGVPAQRTVWMMLIMALLRSGGRRWPWPLVWLASAVGVTILDPWALRQVGFWLSYVAVAVLMASGTPTPESLAAGGAEANGDPEAPAPSLPARLWLSLTAASSEMLRTQWLVTMALTPLAIVCFQQVSVIGFVANMAAIPLFTIGITPLALLGALWSPFWDVGAWLTQLTLSMLVDLSAWPWAVAQAPALPWWVAASVVIGGFALALPARWSWRLAALPFFLPLLHLPQSWHLIPAPRPGQFQMLAVDVGQGTAVLVRTAHHSLLFDAGPRIGEQSDAGDRILLPLLQALGVRELDTLLISHQDTDHVGGAASIVRSLPVAQLISSLDPDHPLRHQPGVSGKALPHEPCVAGQHWAWDGVDFMILHPAAEPDDAPQRSKADKPNAHSCVLRVSRGGDHPVSALIAADIEADQEAAILARAESSDAGLASLQSTVLVAPHHGSRTSSTKAFLQAVNPAQLVIQVGRRNRYGHPSPSVLARYEAMGLPWQATPDCGAYLWSSDEPSLAIRADHAAGASASSLAPRIGSCWRHSHHHYWDAPDTRTTESKQGGAEEPQPP